MVLLWPNWILGGSGEPLPEVQAQDQPVVIRTSDTEKSNLELTCEQLTIKISLSSLGFYEQYSTAPDVPKPLVAEDPVAPARSEA